MITHIHIKNFKSWEDSGRVEFAPLTGFFGTNSSGKSSLLQMLLLLKQTAELSDMEEIIFFGDDNSLVNLGNFREVVHNHDVKNWLELEFRCIHLKTFTPGEDSIDGFTFNTNIALDREGLYIARLDYDSESSNFGIKSVDAKVIGNCYGADAAQHYIKERTKSSFSSLRQFVMKFERLFSHVFFLGPTCVYPQRNFRWEETHPRSIGHFGDKTIDALLSSRVDQLTTPYKEQRVPIEKRISAWLQDMDLAYSFSLKRTEQDYEVRIQRSPDSAEVTLADMGYGLSQFLPVLVLCYYAPEGSTLILEQPGMHLHPKVQSQLADLLIEVVTERNLQVLIESHSEHLLNRLQRRVAEEKIEADQTAVYFCQNDEGVSTIEHLEMDEFGNIKNWPPNFFGDEIGDLFAMTEAQMERQKRAEE